MSNMFENAKPGDEFVCRNGSIRWFVGLSKDGYAVLEDSEGDLHRFGLTGGAHAIHVSDWDIVRRKGQPVTRYGLMIGENGYSTFEAAKSFRDRSNFDATIVRITFTPGEDQE